VIGSDERAAVVQHLERIAKAGARISAIVEVLGRDLGRELGDWLERNARARTEVPPALAREIEHVPALAEQMEQLVDIFESLLEGGQALRDAIPRPS
jgi:hypothetical protein